MRAGRPLEPVAGHARSAPTTASQIEAVAARPTAPARIDPPVAPPAGPLGIEQHALEEAERRSEPRGGPRPRPSPGGWPSSSCPQAGQAPRWASTAARSSAVELAVDVGAEQVARCTDSPFMPLSALRSRARPRWMRLRTVPGGMSSAVGDLGVVAGRPRRTARARRGSRAGGTAAPPARRRAGGARRARRRGRRRRRRGTSGRSGTTSSGRRRRFRTSSRNAFVVILLNQPSSEPGVKVARPRRTRSSTSCTRSCASSWLPVSR